MMPCKTLQPALDTALSLAIAANQAVLRLFRLIPTQASKSGGGLYVPAVFWRDHPSPGYGIPDRPPPRQPAEVADSAIPPGRNAWYRFQPVSLIFIDQKAPG